MFTTDFTCRNKSVGQSHNMSKTIRSMGGRVTENVHQTNAHPNRGHGFVFLYSYKKQPDDHKNESDTYIKSSTRTSLPSEQARSRHSKRLHKRQSTPESRKSGLWAAIGPRFEVRLCPLQDIFLFLLTLDANIDGCGTRVVFPWFVDGVLVSCYWIQVCLWNFIRT